MPVPENDSMACPSCRTRHGVAAWLNTATRSWPERRWVLVHCPSCAATSHVQLLESGVLQIGELDGAPGPSFIVFDAARAPFTARPAATGLSVTLSGHIDRIVPGES